ncbi:MAG: hypothetical protein FJ225_03500 [Lentisphaerae bacterium]|nr:hypothetical protein [Lentisphaerota bacterium]
MNARPVVTAMPNIPKRQQITQRLADQFNADERLWEKLEPRRRLRRKLRPRLSPGKHKNFDLLDFARAQPPKDCIGRHA